MARKSPSGRVAEGYFSRRSRTDTRLFVISVSKDVVKLSASLRVASSGIVAINLVRCCEGVSQLQIQRCGHTYLASGRLRELNVST